METTRRQFVRRAATAGAAAIVAPQALVLPAHGQARRMLRSGRFSDGVISADPTPTSVNLWTRLDEAEGAGRVLLEVASDDDFRKVVSRKEIPTSGAVNHAVKAQVKGLKAHTEYFYRFATDRRDSKVGRFRTAAPADSDEPVRFAYFSCQDWTHGFYNAHEVMLGEDLDFVVCLGDYIYAESYHSRKGGTGVRDDLIGRQAKDDTHEREAVTLQDYRDKWSLYRSDPALRALHQKFPMVYVPDDHEVQDNWSGGEADGGLTPVKQYSAARKRAARKAFYESNARFAGNNGQRLYRSFKFGKTVELFVTDQRSYKADQPCGDAVAPACAELPQPRAFLGRTQMGWLKDGLGASKASWKVIANELMIMPTKVLGDAFYQFDSWQGYPREREELLEHIRARGVKDVVFVTGDIHTFIAGDVRTAAGANVALEFVGGSISSIGLGESDLPVGGGQVIKGNDQNPNTPQVLIDTLRGINPWVDQADFDHHGYGVIEARADGLRSRLVRMETVKRRTRKTRPTTGFTWDVARGQASIKGVNGPPAA
ncbi:MAG TPA: alkaline phosphatase D family protein [Solirubrobacteraceae bacterium]|nr:alkaline phosphatase D family protein [Solirubrobacteraceae bacterium]